MALAFRCLLYTTTAVYVYSARHDCTRDYEYENEDTSRQRAFFQFVEALKSRHTIGQTQEEDHMFPASTPGYAESPDEFDDLHRKYRNLLVSDDFDSTNFAIIKYVKSLYKEAVFYYRTLDKTPKRRTLWLNKKGTTRSRDLTLQFHTLQRLTLAYGTNGTRYYKNEYILSTIKNCLEFLVSSGRYDGKVYYGNWWDWQIGSPLYLLDILVIIKKDLTVEKVKQYTNIINTYVHDPNKKLEGTKHENKSFNIVNINTTKTSSSQKVELARVVLGLGILQKNEKKIWQSLDSIVKVMQPVTTGDGFYKDGSYIEHIDIPYTGSYGIELLKKMGEILVITHDSKWSIPTGLFKPFVAYVESAFLPLVYRGEMIATVNGRAISREPASQNRSDTMYTFLTIAKFALEENKKKLTESVKYWVRQNPDYYLTSARSYDDLLNVISLLNDSSVEGENIPYLGAKMYASMDRFVHQTINYTLGISLYSNRISAFETGNSENKRGWHTADGAIYLYNYDDVQFTDAFWPTVDPYRFPGTTVDTRHLNDELSNWQHFYSKEKWVGGVAHSNQALVGMFLNKEGFKNYDIITGKTKLLLMNIKAKKSWFIVEGQIVALGAGITGTTTASIETIVDNRLLNDRYKYKVLSNYGQINSIIKGLSVNWLLLKSDHKRSSIGYFFPRKETVDIIFETRNGTYKDINVSGSKKVYTGEYHKILIKHGQRPINASYAYVLLPGIDESKLKEYSQSKTVNILENSAQIQAVEIMNKGFLGINIWDNAGGTIMGISSNKPVSLMRQTNGFQQTYILSDPTQSDNIIILKIPKFSSLLTTSERIEYTKKRNEFIVDFTEARGASEQFTVTSLE